MKCMNNNRTIKQQQLFVKNTENINYRKMSNGCSLIIMKKVIAKQKLNQIHVLRL